MPIILSILCFMLAQVGNAQELEIKILTYNTHLFGNIDFHEIVGKLAKVSYQDKIRAKEIIKRLRNSGADIIFLQEVWDEDLQKDIKKGLSDIYPHGYRPGHETNAEAQAKVYAKTKDFKRIIALGSGLMILAKKKFDFFDRGHKDFIRMHKENFLTRKGTGKVIIKTKVNGEQIGVSLMTSHLPTGFGDNPKDGKGWFDHVKNKSLDFRKKYPNYPVIIGGDFNMTEYKSGEPEKLKSEYVSILKKEYSDVGLTDAWRSLYSKNKGYTVTNQISFGLKKVEVNKESDTEKGNKRIDYFFFNKFSGNNKYSCEPKSMRVIKNYKYKDPVKNELRDLSDHYPLEATFVIRKIK